MNCVFYTNLEDIKSVLELDIISNHRKLKESNKRKRLLHNN